MESFANITEHFFVLDSDNLKNVQSKLYGFVIGDKRFTANKSHYDAIIDNSECGTYTNVTVKKNKIIIQQDYWGFFGLFLFRHRDYFALSNSFFALLLHLYKKFNLTPDDTYIKYFLLEPLASLSYLRTPVKEIVQLPKNVLVSIKIKEKELECYPISQQEARFPIDSADTFAILDAWHNKFSRFLTAAAKTENVSFDISGGFDSRLTLTVTSDKQDILKHINFKSLTDKNHQEDYFLADQLGRKLNFALNQNLPKEIFSLPYENSIMGSFYSKLGLHGNFRFYTQFHAKPIFNFSGAGGENLRGAWNGSKNEFLQNYIPFVCEKITEWKAQAETVLQDSFIAIENDWQSNTVSTLYKNTRMRNHFGKMTAEYLPSNVFWIAPLLDPALYTICLTNKIDPMLLAAIIFQRYFPELLSVRFDSGKKIDTKTLEIADAIQKKYPKFPQPFCAYEIDYTPIPFTDNAQNAAAAERLFTDLIFEPGVKHNICRYFSSAVYEYLLETLKSETWYANRKVKTVLSMLIVLQICGNKDFDEKNPVLCLLH